MQADGARSPMSRKCGLTSRFKPSGSAPRSLTSAIWCRPRYGSRRSTRLTERVFELRALAESSVAQSARVALRSDFKGGTITMTPEPFGDGQAYVARAELLPLFLLIQNATELA
jgi:hypothetical protein